MAKMIVDTEARATPDVMAGTLMYWREPILRSFKVLRLLLLT